MLSRSILSRPLRSSSVHRITHRLMSSPALVIPFDHQSSKTVVPGVDPVQLWSTTPAPEKVPKVGTTRTFYNTPPPSVTALSSLGPDFAKKSGNPRRELVRKSVGSAVKDVKALDGVDQVTVDASADPHAAGMCTAFLILIITLSALHLDSTFIRGRYHLRRLGRNSHHCLYILLFYLIFSTLTAVAAYLALFKFTLKTSPPSRFNPNLTEPIPEKIAIKPASESQEWDRGVVYAKAQNLARTV